MIKWISVDAPFASHSEGKAFIRADKIEAFSLHADAIIFDMDSGKRYFRRRAPGDNINDVLAFLPGEVIA